MFLKKVLTGALALICGMAGAQAPVSHTFAALDTTNVFTGLNSFAKINGVYTAGVLASTVQATATAACGAGGSIAVLLPPGFVTTEVLTSIAGCSSVYLSDQRTAVSENYIWNGTAYVSTGTSGGSVNSVSVGNLAPIFTATVSSPSSSPNITYILSPVAAGAFLSGPTSGQAQPPTYRGLVASDLPLATGSAVGVVRPDGTTCTVSGAGVLTCGGSSGGLTSVTATTPIVATPSTGTVALSLASSGVTAGNYNLGGQVVHVSSQGLITSVGNPFGVALACTAAGNYEIGYATANPNVCTISYSNGTAASASLSDGSHTVTLSSPFTNGSLGYSYLAGTTFNVSAVSTTSQSASASTSFNASYCTFSGITSNASPGGATASGSSSGNQCGSETSTLTGGGTLSSNGLGSTNVGQVFSFGSPAGNYVSLLVTETGSGCNRNPFLFNGSSPVNGTTHAISSYTNILGGTQLNMCLYTFGPYSSAVTLEVAH